MGDTIAEVADTVEELTSNIRESLFLCYICQESAEHDPVSMTCKAQHVFCFKCIFDFYKNHSENVSLCCPTCRHGNGSFLVMSRLKQFGRTVLKETDHLRRVLRSESKHQRHSEDESSSVGGATPTSRNTFGSEEPHVHSSDFYVAIPDLQRKFPFKFKQSTQSCLITTRQMLLFVHNRELLALLLAHDATNSGPLPPWRDANGNRIGRGFVTFPPVSFEVDELRTRRNRPERLQRHHGFVANTYHRVMHTRHRSRGIVPFALDSLLDRESELESEESEESDSDNDSMPSLIDPDTLDGRQRQEEEQEQDQASTNVSDNTGNEETILADEVLTLMRMIRTASIYEDDQHVTVSAPQTEPPVVPRPLLSRSNRAIQRRWTAQGFEKCHLVMTFQRRGQDVHLPKFRITRSLSLAMSNLVNCLSDITYGLITVIRLVHDQNQTSAEGDNILPLYRTMGQFPAARLSRVDDTSTVRQVLDTDLESDSLGAVALSSIEHQIQSHFRYGTLDLLFLLEIDANG